jgi:serine/threonine protein phosphatase PrpC
MKSSGLAQQWRALAVSLCGVSHQKMELPCQDALALEILDNGMLIAALADGAGSATFAEVGSNLAATRVVEVLHARLETNSLPHEEECRRFLQEAVQEAKEKIEEAAASREVQASDLATTLIILIAAPDFIAAAQIGDGSVVVSDQDGKLMSLTDPQSGEYINETSFLISPGALEQMQTEVYRGKVKHLAAFTDGLQRLALKLPENTPYEPFFQPLFRFMENVTEEEQAQEQLTAFLSSPRIQERTEDDLTLLLATLQR